MKVNEDIYFSKCLDKYPHFQMRKLGHREVRQLSQGQDERRARFQTQTCGIIVPLLITLFWASYIIFINFSFLGEKTYLKKVWGLDININKVPDT